MSDDDILTVDNAGLEIARIFLDTNEIEVIRHIHFECTNCGLCCKANRIPLREEDIERLQEQGYELDQLFEEISPVLISSQNIDGNFIKAYILRKKPFSNECIFLDENNMCKVHEFKPLACRIYPFAIRKETDSTVLVIIHPHSVCPAIEVDVGKDRSNTLQIAQELSTQ